MLCLYLSLVPVDHMTVGSTPGPPRIRRIRGQSCDLVTPMRLRERLYNLVNLEMLTMPIQVQS